jgi:hypothetical protein
VGEVKEKVEGQQFTRGVQNTNMTDCVKKTFRVLSLYSSFVHGEHLSRKNSMKQLSFRND